MNKLLLVALFLFGTACVASAQDEQPMSTDAVHNVAADFASTSAANAAFTPVSMGMILNAPPKDRLLFQTSSRASMPLAAAVLPLETSTNISVADPAPAAPNPKFIYGSRDDYRWELGLGFAVVRFRSPVFFATAAGLNTWVAYYTNEWFAVEGSITAAFAPQIFDREHVKYLGYDIGPKIAWRQRKWEPWAHALFGGAHILPETGLDGRNGYEMEAGGGIDYRVNPRFSVRLETDWLRTGLMGQTENSAQAILGVIAHF